MEIGKKYLRGSNLKYVFEDHDLELDRFMNKFIEYESHRDFVNLVYNHLGEFRYILEDFITPLYKKVETLLNYFIFGKSKILFVMGARDGGKTCCSFWIAEEIHKRLNKLKIAYVGVEVDKKVLPKWCDNFKSINDVPNGYLIILDEMALQFNAREFMKGENIDLGKLLAICRHKDLRVILIAQDPNMTDPNAWRLRDMMLYKQSNTYELPDRESKGNQTSKVMKFWKFIKNWMKPKRQEQALFEYPAKSKIMLFEYPIPACWSDELSKAFSNYDVTASRKESEKSKKNFNKIYKKVKQDDFPIS